jgi:ribosome-binding protein aMBF1 (putative translation factor)
VHSIENETESFHVRQTGLDLATRLKTLRAQKEMTQRDLALLASVKVDVVRDYENCRGVPDARLICRLEQILGGALRERNQRQ